MGATAALLCTDAAVAAERATTAPVPPECEDAAERAIAAAGAALRTKTPASRPAAGAALRAETALGAEPETDLAPRDCNAAAVSGLAVRGIAADRAFWAQKTGPLRHSANINP
jgi:hypothetical protein